MRTLQITKGDLVVGSGGYALVDGEAKLRQDTGLAVSETYGTDRFHPRWGSILENYIGQPISAEIQLFVQSEIQRVLNNYSMMQQDRLQADLAKGLKSRFSPSELIRDIPRVDVVQSFDQLHVRVWIETQSGVTSALVLTASDQLLAPTVAAPEQIGVLNVPDPCTGLTASLGVGIVNLSWSPPRGNGGAPIIGYNIYRSTTSGVFHTVLAHVGPGVTSYVDTDFPAPPTAPQNIQATPGITSVGLTWDVPVSTGGDAINEYIIYRSTTPGVQGVQIAAVGATTTSFVDSGIS